jgi:hypothetical protein
MAQLHRRFLGKPAEFGKGAATGTQVFITKLSRVGMRSIFWEFPSLSEIHQIEVHNNACCKEQFNYNSTYSFELAHQLQTKAFVQCATVVQV